MNMPVSAEGVAASKLPSFSNRLVMIGFGSIGQAVLPMLMQRLGVRPDHITIIAASARAQLAAQDLGVGFVACPLTESNHLSVLEPLLGSGDFLLNVSVCVSSLALIELCWRRGALYLDTCIEPWAGGYTDPSKSISSRSNYALREGVLAFGRAKGGGPTAIVAQGANPGLASSFVKQALLHVATNCGRVPTRPPVQREEWAALARNLGIKTIHISERDTQSCQQRRARDEFVNTWSIAGLIAEGTQPSELGWGSHERHWPADAARHGFGCDAAIYLNRPGMATRVRSWTPLEGAFHGFLITHGESISIADHLTLVKNGALVYRPTVHYAYHPSDDTVLSIHAMAGKNWHPPASGRILRDDIVSGMDELGVLLMGNDRGVFWYGSQLTIAQARELVPFNNATSLQVAAGILAGMVWALRHPAQGVVEPDDLDHELVLSVARPYLGHLVGVWDDWTPLQGRSSLFSEDLETSDPWQFKNIRVA